MGHDGINVEGDQLGRQSRQAVKFSLGPAVLDDEVSAFLVSQVSEALSQGRSLAAKICGRRLAEKPQPIDSCCLLRLGGERRGEETTWDKR